MPRAVPFTRMPGSARALACAVLALGLTAGVAACSAAGSPAIGAWGDTSPGTPHLVLEANGKVTGNDGCNRLSGAWKASGKAVEFREMAATQMYCEGVDTWLSKATGATVAGDTLSLVDAAGAKLGTLERS